MITGSGLASSFLTGLLIKPQVVLCQKSIGSRVYAHRAPFSWVSATQQFQSKMKNKAILTSALFAGLTCIAQSATTILQDGFATTSVGDVAGWTETGGNLFGQGIGVSNNADYPGGTASNWAFFQTNETTIAGMFRSTGTVGLNTQTIIFTFDLGGHNSAGNRYTGSFTASIWDGSPTGGGTQLATINPANPGAGVSSPITLSHTLTANTTNNIFVQFNAGVTSAGSDFDQALVDNVLVTIPEPSIALLGAFGTLCLLRRRR